MPKQLICKLGKYDMPVVQQQPDFEVDLLQSNVLLFGSPQSGKTNLLKLIINILHKKCNTRNERIFILDFSGALADYREMPLVSAYFDNSNEEYVKRVFKILEKKVKDNTKKLGGDGFARSGEALPHYTFLIDNFNAFLDEPRYSEYQEKFLRLCRDGISKGLTILATASDTKGISRYLGSFPQKIALNLTDDKYAEIFVTKVRSIGNIPGRGFANVTFRERIPGTFNQNLPYEVHLSYAEALDLPDFRTNLYEKFSFRNGAFTAHVTKYQVFPPKLTEDAFAQLRKGQSDPAEYDPYQYTAGLDYVDFEPVTVDFRESRCLAVYAKKDFGREELIRRIVLKLTRNTDRKIVLLDDGSEKLKEIAELFRDPQNPGAYLPRCKYICKYVVQEMALAGSEAAERSRFPDGAKAVLADLPSYQKQATPTRTSSRKLSPMLQFYQYIHEHCVDLGNHASLVYLNTEYKNLNRNKDIPVLCTSTQKDPTLFVIQSRLIYSSASENKKFLQSIFPMLMDIAEERDYIFLFSDVRRITDRTTSDLFNSFVHCVFLLDNIAEFVAERGQKTIFGEMDVKMLKADYAKCEPGDGYFYHVEADKLKKLKFIQEEC